jgi:hypothetical protein
MLGATLPWWTMTTTYASTPPEVSSVSAYLAGYLQLSGTNPTNFNSCTFTGNTGEAGYQCPVMSTTGELFRIAYGMVLLSVACLALSLALVGLSPWLGGSPIFRARAATVLPFVAFGLLFGAWTLVTTTLTGTLRSDAPNPGSGFFGVANTCQNSPTISFFGNCPAMPLGAQWGGSLGWVLTLVSGLCALAGAVTIWDLYLQTSRRVRRGRNPSSRPA